jgi:hypothetical protein
MVDLKGVLQYWDASKDFCTIPFIGQIKGENHTRRQLLYSVNETDSGFWKLMQRLIVVHQLRRRSTGPAFVNPVTNFQSTTSEMKDLLFEILTTELFDASRDLFDVDAIASSNLVDKYNVFRTFRRGLESQAVVKRVSEADRYVVNRWRRKEAAGASRVSHPIDQHCVNVSLVKNSFLRYYTKSM